MTDLKQEVNNLAARHAIDPAHKRWLETDAIETLSRLVEEERERCAKIANDWLEGAGEGPHDTPGDAIRAQSN